MSEQINLLTQEYPDEQGKIYLNSIRQIVNQNNGMISTRMVDILDIDRQYLSIMKKIMNWNLCQEEFMQDQMSFRIVIICSK